MEIRNFHASVQYDDWKGSARADDHDLRSLISCLKEKNLIKDEEFLVGIEMYSGEVHTATQDENVDVRALLATGEGYDNISAAVQSGKPLKVREVELEMKLNEFFGFFKRFAISVSRDGIIDGLNIEAFE